MVLYSFADTARILRVSPARLRYWERTELVRPSSETEAGERVFAWQDLVELRTILKLIDRGVPVRRIRHSLDRYRRRTPGEAPDVAALCVLAHRPEVVVRSEGAWEAPDGQLLMDFPDPEASEVAVLEEVREDPEGEASALDWFERGCTLDGDPATFAESLDAYRRALELDPGFADAHCNVGTVHFNRGERAAAKVAYQAAIEIEPEHLEANFNLANLLEESGQREAALFHYKAAVRSDPFFADARLNLALLYEKLALPGQAREQWRHYLQRVPDGHWADLARDRLKELPAGGGSED